MGGVDNGIVQPSTMIGEFRGSSEMWDTLSEFKKNFGGKLCVSTGCQLERYPLGQVGPIAPCCGKYA